jgi:hypothetical protein
LQRCTVTYVGEADELKGPRRTKASICSIECDRAFLELKLSVASSFSAMKAAEAPGWTTSKFNAARFDSQHSAVKITKIEARMRSLWKV